MSLRKKERGVHTYYEIRGGKLVRRLKKCPRCGVFMAFHKEPRSRWTCGACSYTEYVYGSKARTGR